MIARIIAEIHEDWCLLLSNEPRRRGRTLTEGLCAQDRASGIWACIIECKGAGFHKRKAGAHQLLYSCGGARRYGARALPVVRQASLYYALTR